MIVLFLPLINVLKVVEYIFCIRLTEEIEVRLHSRFCMG